MVILQLLRKTIKDYASRIFLLLKILKEAKLNIYPANKEDFFSSAFVVAFVVNQQR